MHVFHGTVAENYDVRVNRVAGETHWAVLRVRARATQIHEERVWLADGAQLGPAPADVQAWQDKAVAIIDAHRRRR
jgi:hypothetical protein